MGRAVQNPDAPVAETLPPGLPSTLKRPEDKAIRSFKPWMVGDDTIGTLLDEGWSLGICCRACGRTVECKPQWLADRFGDRRGLRLADLLPRLACAPPNGCGSHDVAIFPYCEPAAPVTAITSADPRSSEQPPSGRG